MELAIGDHVQVDLPGVPEWKIPPVSQTATVTDENRLALLADVEEQARHGAKVKINGSEV